MNSNNPNEEKICALYIRVSTDAQAEEGYSIPAQTEKLEAYCAVKGWTRFDLYVDGGYSGSNLNRPEIQRLIADAQAGRLANVVVYKLDRLSRSQKDTLYLIEDVFLPNEVGFVSINENFDTTTPFGRAMIGILSVFAQLERENIYLRTRMGMLERVKQGLWRGGGADTVNNAPNVTAPLPGYDRLELSRSTPEQSFSFDVSGANFITFALEPKDGSHMSGIMLTDCYLYQ